MFRINLNYFFSTLIVISLIFLILLLARNCQKIQIEEKYELKRDTLIRIDTIVKEKAKEYVKIIVKKDTIEKEKIKYDTIYLFNLYKYQYQDTLIYIEFLANYLDSTSLKYKLLKKEDKKQKTQYKNNIITIYAKDNLNSYGLIYQKRIFYHFYMGVLFEKDYKDYKIGVSLSYSF